MIFLRSLKTKFHYQRKFLIHYLVILFLTPAIIFFIYTLLPPKVNAAQALVDQEIDQPLSVTIWGGVNKKSLIVKTYPATAVKTTFSQGLDPLKTGVLVSPSDIFIPDSEYKVVLTVKNWYGVETKKIVAFKTGSLPKVVKGSPIKESKDISASSKITFSLTKVPSAGTLLLVANPSFKYKTQEVGNEIIFQPLAKLTQGVTYAVSLVYQTNSQVTSLGQSSFSIINPLEIVSSTPTDKATLVPKQTSLVFSFNKAVNQSTLAKSFSIKPQLQGSFNWKDPKTFEFLPTASLTTATAYSVSFLDSLTGLDNSTLAENKTIVFTTAGVVKVISFSPQGSYASQGSSVVVGFDQPVDKVSAESRFSISPTVPGSFGWQGNQLIFKPTALNSLTNYTVTLAKGIKSIGGDDSKDNFTSSFGTTSERTRVIGYSVKGRAINASFFGVGGKKILLVGTMHGSESNTGDMLTSFINYLRGNQTAIGSDRTFIIVPYANPDGRASNQRFNANGVDLNRNWDLPDWQMQSYWLNNVYPTGGGTVPFSEPENRALRDLILGENPVRIISYHSAASLVIAGSYSSGFGSWYANLTGYDLSVGSTEDSGSCLSALGYCITGTMEEWAEKKGYITIVVEFSSATSPEYSKNLPALKGLLNYSL